MKIGIYFAFFSLLSSVLFAQGVSRSQQNTALATISKYRLNLTTGFLPNMDLAYRGEQKFSRSLELSFFYVYSYSLEFGVSLSSDKSVETDASLSLERVNTSLFVSTRYRPFDRFNAFYLSLGGGIKESSEVIRLGSLDFSANKHVTSTRLVKKNPMLSLELGLEESISRVLPRLNIKDEAFRVSTGLRYDKVPDKEYLDSLFVKALGLGYSF